MMKSEYLRRPDAQGHLYVMQMLRKLDPIGVFDDYQNPNPACADEYDSYAAPIVRMLDQGCPAADLAAHLRQIAAEHMGLSRTREDELAIATELVEWWKEWTAAGRGRS